MEVTTLATANEINRYALCPIQKFDASKIVIREPKHEDADVTLGLLVNTWLRGPMSKPLDLSGTTRVLGQVTRPTGSSLIITENYDGQRYASSLWHLANL